MDFFEIIDKLREKDCVEISTCYKPHGCAVFVYLGEGSKKCIVGSSGTIKDTKKAFIAAANDAYKTISEDNK